MTINEANTDFICRATPHPQTASPLQWRITEEQQAKEDLIHDEIEGLDAEVLLNATTRKEGKPAMLDLEEQEAPLPMLLPPSCNLHTPPTLQHSPPASAQSVASIADPIQQLVQALLTIGQNAAPPPPPHLLITNQSRVRAPDTFDGSNPEDLRAFLLQCQITFNSYPQQYATDTAKVFFMISYLKKMVLEWFKQGILEDDLSLTPAWRHSWAEFAKELKTHFGPANPVGSPEIELQHLVMSSNTKLSKYLVRFNTLALQADGAKHAPRFQF